jgi:hypothetical protein
MLDLAKQNGEKGADKEALVKGQKDMQAKKEAAAEAALAAQKK